MVAKADGERLMPCDWYTIETLKGHVTRYLFATQFVSNKVCLDIACGSGYGSHRLRNGGARMVVGGDNALKGIEYATKNYAQNNVHFMLLDGQQLPFTDISFDIIVSMATIEHIKNPSLFISECHRLIKPGGLFLCSAVNKAMYSPYSQEPYGVRHFQEFYIDEFEALVSEYFGEIEIYGQGFQVKGIKFELYQLLKHKILPLIRSLPKGGSLVNFLFRIVRRHKYTKLEGLEEEVIGGIEDSITLFPQKGREPVLVILVAKK